MLAIVATFCTLTLGRLTVGSGLPCVTIPADVGIASERLTFVDSAMERGLAEGGYPGAAVVIGRRGEVVLERGYGRLGWAARSPAVSADSTLYDLASLTKVVATTAAAMVLYDDRRLVLDAPVARYVPAFAGGGRERVTVRQLLMHRSGLPAGRDLWRVAHTPGAARRELLRTALQAPPGARYEYSDVGADVLGFVVEAAAGEPLDRFVRRRVFAPLGMASTNFRPARALRARTAPTEQRPPRGYALQGEVHDENAYALGGVAGHAGLFSTASDLSIFAQMLLDGGVHRGKRVIQDSTVRLFTRLGPGWRGLGFDGCPGSGSCGQRLSRTAFGHTGYTGTSMWIDPERQMFVIVLSNWAHGDAAHRPSRWVLAEVRAEVADLAASAVVIPPARRTPPALGGPRPVPAAVPVAAR